MINASLTERTYCVNIKSKSSIFKRDQISTYIHLFIITVPVVPVVANEDLTMMNASSCQRLPTTGETVVLKNLVSSPALNGKRGQVIRYKEDLHRYVVKLRLLDDADGSEKTKTLSLKPENVSLLLIDNRETNDAASSIRGNDAFYFCGDWGNSFDVS